MKTRDGRPYRHMLLACLLLSLSGCANLFESRSERDLRDAEARWKASNITDYMFEMRTSCFCPSEIYEWAVVEVKNGQVLSAKSLSGVPLTGNALTSRLTVDQLFDKARSPYPDWVGQVDFQFDSVLGYPLRLSLEGKPNIADAGVVFEARNLQPAVR